MTIIITGGSSGLGLCIRRILIEDGHEVIDWSLQTGVDVRDEFNVLAHASALPPSPIDVLINCAGVNGIDYLSDLTEGTWDRVMDTNAKGIYLCTRALLEHLRDGTVLNVISNASHVPMTCSLAYNASKGAAKMMTKQLSRELIKTHNITVFGISPNKLANTGMSAFIDQRVMELRGWTLQQAREYQLASLPAGEETDPDVLAEFIVYLLSSKQRHKYLAGCIINYGL